MKGDTINIKGIFKTKNITKVACLIKPENIETDVTLEETLLVNDFQIEPNGKFFEVNSNEEFSI